MLIRCEKCSTLYELDEKLIPSGGAPVQCTKCQFVFRAYPPEAGASRSLDATAIAAAEPVAASTSTTASTSDSTSTWTPTPTPGPAAEAGPAPRAAAIPEATAPAAPAPPRPTAPSRPTPTWRQSAQESADAPTGEPLRSSPALRAPVAGQAPETKFTPDGRPIRKVPFPSDDGVGHGSARPSVARAAARAVPVKPKRRPLPWIVPAALGVAILLVVAAVIAWRLLSRRADPTAVQRRVQGQSLLLRDDPASLAAAAVAFEEAARLDPRPVPAQADQVLAHALVLGLVQGEAARLEGRLAAREAERARAGASWAPTPAGVDQVETLRVQRETVRGRVQRVEAEAEAELAPLLRVRADDLAVRRARAMLDAFASDASRPEAALARDRALRGKDPWLDLALAAAEVRAASPERRAEGAARLDALAAANPALLRARLLAAEAHAQAGRAGPAVAALDALLAANPDHELALELKAEVLAPPPLRPADLAPVPSFPPPRGRAGPLPKKDDPQARAEAGR